MAAVNLYTSVSDGRYYASVHIDIGDNLNGFPLSISIGDSLDEVTEEVIDSAIRELKDRISDLKKMKKMNKDLKK